jgi:hypothetical protein
MPEVTHPFEEKPAAPAAAMHEPVRVRVEPQSRILRIHVLIRLALLVAFGVVGFSSIYWALYLAVPPLVAAAILQRGGDGYLAEDAPRLRSALTWLAGAYAYLWLLTDRLPSTREAGVVTLDLVPSGRPTPGTALARLVTSLPALLLLVVLSLVSAIAWVVGAIGVLVAERMPDFVVDTLTFTLRFKLRFFAYHLSLVDRYPGLGDAPRA